VELSDVDSEEDWRSEAEAEADRKASARPRRPGTPMPSRGSFMEESDSDGSDVSWSDAARQRAAEAAANAATNGRRVQLEDFSDSSDDDVQCLDGGAEDEARAAWERAHAEVSRLSTRLDPNTSRNTPPSLGPL